MSEHDSYVVGISTQRGFEVVLRHTTRRALEVLKCNNQYCWIGGPLAMAYGRVLFPLWYLSRITTAR